MLIGCNTAAEDESLDASPLSGLVNAFFLGGSTTVLAAYWEVSEGISARLTRELIRTWKQAKVPKAEALRRAMSTVRKQEPNGVFAHPYYWG